MILHRRASEIEFHNIIMLLLSWFPGVTLCVWISFRINVHITWNVEKLHRDHIVSRSYVALFEITIYS